MQPIKPTFSEVVYAEMATWLGRTPCKSCNTTVTFDVRCGLAVASIKSMGRFTSVCVDLDWPEHRHESLGFDGKSTHPNRLQKMNFDRGALEGAAVHVQQDEDGERIYLQEWGHE